MDDFLVKFPSTDDRSWCLFFLGVIKIVVCKYCTRKKDLRVKHCKTLDFLSFYFIFITLHFHYNVVFFLESIRPDRR